MSSFIKNIIKANSKDAMQVASATVIDAQGQSREKLLRSAIICATNGNEKSKSLIRSISAKLGTISYEDFLYMDELISSSQYKGDVENINAFLSANLKGFKQAHNIYYYALQNL